MMRQIWTKRTRQITEMWLLHRLPVLLVLIGVGRNSAVAMAQNTVRAWGDNSKGQLEDRPTALDATGSLRD